MKEKNQKVIDGALAVGYIVLLLGSAYFVPPIWVFLENHFPWHPFLPQLLAVFLLILPLRLLLRESFRIPLFLASGAFFFYAMTRLEKPVEQIHFIEYGGLSFVLFRSLRHSLRIPWSYLGSIAAASGIGVIDELLQGLLPNRVYDTRDLWINFWSAGLGMVLFATLLTPRSV